MVILLLDGRRDEETFKMMNGEGAFPRLLELVQDGVDDAGLHRMLLELLYDMSRIQRLRLEDLSTQILLDLLWKVLMGPAVLIEDDFLAYMFRIIEEFSDDVNDPYHYPVIRVVVCLNSREESCKLIDSNESSS